MPYGKQKEYKNDQLKRAVESVRSGALSIRKASLEYGVPKSTIGDRISGKTSNMNVIKGKQTALSPEVEAKIANTVIKASQLGVGITRKQLFMRTGALVKRTGMKTPFKNQVPGKDWWQGMKKRHPALSIRKTEKLGSVRCRMMNREKVSSYFSDLGKYLTKFNLMDKPHLIWNCDENGKSFEHDPGQVIAERGAKNVVSRTSTNSTHVTIMACGNAAGYRMPPLIIAEGKTRRCLFGFNTEAAPTGTMWDFQKNGWIDDRIAEKWFRDVFLKHCGAERPQLLILDGHSSHETLAIIMEALENYIEILCLPPHTTHYLQPFDRSVFGPLNKAYADACSEFLNQNKLHQVNKWTFPALLNIAWDNAVTARNIKSGFRACGIFPYNAKAIPESAYMPSTLTESFIAHPQSSNSTCTVPAIHSTDLPVSPLYGNKSDFPASISTSAIDLEVSVGHGKPGDVTCDSLLVDLHTPDIFTRTDSASTMLVQVEPNFSDSYLDILNAEIVATADDDGIATIPETWNSQIEELFLPALQTDVTSTSVDNRKSKAVLSHRLLTSADIVNEKKMIAEEKERREKEKLMKQQKAQERKLLREKKKEEQDKQKLKKQIMKNTNK